MKKVKYEHAPASGRNWLIPVLSIVLVLLVGVGATLAYFSLTTDPVINTFQAGSAGVVINEKVSGNVKSEITVTNTGKTPVFVRVRLVSYLVDTEGNVLAQSSPSVNFTKSDNWVIIGDYYYYNAPLGAGATTADLLNTDIEMTTGQVIEVMADVIQSTPAQAVVDAWGVDASAFIGK